MEFWCSSRSSALAVSRLEHNVSCVFLTYYIMFVGSIWDVMIQAEKHYIKNLFIHFYSQNSCNPDRIYKEVLCFCLPAATSLNLGTLQFLLRLL